MLTTMVALLQEERIVPIISRVYPVQRIREALAYVGEGRHIGKVVISHTPGGMVDRTEQCIQRLVEQKQRAEAEQAHSFTSDRRERMQYRAASHADWRD
jgi:Zinc-binding dehydrogenase